MIDLTPLVQAIVALAGALITAYVVPYIKNKVDAQKLERMQSWVRVGITAAEQLFSESGQGEKKKAYVLAFLNQHGFTIDASVLDALIESGVNSVKNEQRFALSYGIEVEPETLSLKGE